MFVFDTDTFTHFVDGDNEFIRDKANANLDRICISIVSIEEIMKGALKSINNARGPKSNITVVEAYEFFFEAYSVLRLFTVLPYTEEADRVFEGFPSGVRGQHTNDCRIAAISIAYGMVLVTCNTRDYRKIPGVTVEDWSVNPLLGIDWRSIAPNSEYITF